MLGAQEFLCSCSYCVSPFGGLVWHCLGAQASWPIPARPVGQSQHGWLVTQVQPFWWPVTVRLVTGNTVRLVTGNTVRFVTGNTVRLVATNTAGWERSLLGG